MVKANILECMMQLREWGEVHAPDDTFKGKSKLKILDDAIDAIERAKAILSPEEFEAVMEPIEKNFARTAIERGISELWQEWMWDEDKPPTRH
jgi:hypothetical protein